MINIDIPGADPKSLKYLAADFSGTLSVDGVVSPDVIERLNRLAQSIEIHVLTADTHGKVVESLANVDCTLVKIGSNVTYQDRFKSEYIEKLGADSVFAIGNGKNDRLMLKKAVIGVAVCLDEGCATETLVASDIVVRATEDALDLLLHPNRLKATLRN